MQPNLQSTVFESRRSKRVPRGEQRIRLQERLREVLERDRALVAATPGGRSDPHSGLTVIEPREHQPEQTADDEEDLTSQIEQWITEELANDPAYESEGPIVLSHADGPADEEREEDTQSIAVRSVPRPPPPPCSEPIRTRTMAQLLARQGYPERALSIYALLIHEQPGDHALQAEAAVLRDQANAVRAKAHALAAEPPE